MAQIAACESAGDGVGIMNTALPYYLSQRSAARSISFSAYRNDVYNKVTESLGNYDFRSVGQRLPTSALALYGEEDIELPQDVAELGLAQVKTIRGAGHFSFAERPDEFMQALRSALES